MAEVTEVVKASSRDEAIEIVASLYSGVLVDAEVVSRRNDVGQFSKTGHTFLIRVIFEEEEPDEEAPEDLGKDEY